MKTKKSKLPAHLIAVRKADREMEFVTLGQGFHAKTRVVVSKKVYKRKQKHKECFD